jgi:hypothetical protein
MDEQNKILENSYGRYQYHSRTNEAFGFDQATVEYQPIDDLRIILETIECNLNGDEIKQDEDQSYNERFDDAVRAEEIELMQGNVPDNIDARQNFFCV